MHFSQSLKWVVVGDTHKYYVQYSKTLLLSFLAFATTTVEVKINSLTSKLRTNCNNNNLKKKFVAVSESFSFYSFIETVETGNFK